MLCLLSFCAAAQEYRATLSGRITDPQGAVIASARISVTQVDTSAKSETLSGGDGSDRFIFASEFGIDTILDFAASGVASDLIEFSTSVFSNFAEVQAASTQDGANVVIEFDQANAITLSNTLLSDLNSSNFEFV
jgi:hypothetical protein